MPPLLRRGGSSWSSLPAFLLETFPALPISPLLMFYLFFEAKHPKLHLGLQQRPSHLGSARPLIFGGAFEFSPSFPRLGKQHSCRSGRAGMQGLGITALAVTQCLRDTEPLVGVSGVCNNCLPWLTGYQTRTFHYSTITGCFAETQRCQDYDPNICFLQLWFFVFIITNRFCFLPAPLPNPSTHLMTNESSC